MIHELASGTDSTIAVAKAMDAYNGLKGRKRENEEATERQRCQDDQYLAADEEITRKVSCPTCGSEARMKCRGTGVSGGLKKKSHTDRYQLTRSLGPDDSKGRS
ncbi:zinc finger domain-containing protein (plasmid) [Streptomyces sp. GDS52]|uniref:zinc finger domain-containing protein n=1 Tax=Streptomyces sp. GDS52 TaxID=3406419 RepID=UPI003FD09651